MKTVWPLPERFRIRLTMETDWHVGSGMGRPGHLDRLIARDADGLPFVPAKTVRGIWRDACERLCRGLGDNQRGDWSRLVDHLFGSQPALANTVKRDAPPFEAPLESSLRIRSARIPNALRDHLVRADCRLRQALTFVKPGIKIDPATGSAQTDFLRFEEVARRGTVLEAECRLSVPQNAREAASALLIASARVVERLGGKRRRGLGRCRLEILDADGDKAIDWLERTTEAPSWESSEASEPNPPLTPQPFPTPNETPDGWVRVPLVLRLQSPLAISHRTTGNVVETLDFVPGSLLLPHVTRVLGHLGLAVRDAIQAGTLCVLPAHPVVDGERGLPVPLALFAPKGLPNPLDPNHRRQVLNRLCQHEPTEGSESDRPQLKQLREGYVSSQFSRVVKPPILVRTHNTIQDDVQRPTSEVGGVYTYEALSPNDGDQPVVLRSELRIRQSLADQLPSEWWRDLSGDLSLGRSKKDDYGAVHLTSEPPLMELPPTSRNINTHELMVLMVWLVSDTLVRNRRLRLEPTSESLREELQRRLGNGVRLTKRPETKGLLDEAVRVRRLDTWHVGWGLPRASLVALQAGSCVVFRVEGTLDPARLAQIEASGIGERTAEGYGQVRLDLPMFETLDQPRDSETSASPPASPQRQHVAPGEPIWELARMLERECWKRELLRACLERANSSNDRKQLLDWDTCKGQSRPPMSQLGGLRQQLARLRTPDDRMAIVDWLNHLERNPRRKDKWPSIPKVKELIDNNQRIWDVIQPDAWPTLTQNASTDLKTELWALAVRTFFDACIRAHKRELEKHQSREEAAHGA